MTAAPPNRERSWAPRDLALIAALLVLAVLWSFREIYSPDIGFHLKAGTWILENHRVPGQEVFAYAIGTRQYIDTYWLYQVLMALTERAAGAFGLVALNAFLVAGTVLLLIVRMARRTPLKDQPLWPLAAFLGVAAMAVLFETRPHTFSWLFLGLTFWILDAYRAGRRRVRFLLIPLTIVWVNMHTLYVLGWVVLGCYALAEVWEQRTIWSPLLGTLMLCLAAAFVNPYGSDGVLLPFTQFQFLQPANIFKSTIAEYQSPFLLSGYTVNGSFVLIQPLFAFHVFTVVAIGVMAWTVRRRPLVDLLAFAAFAYIGLTGVKNIGYAVVAILPMIAAGPVARRTENVPPLGARILSAVRDFPLRQVAAGLTAMMVLLAGWSVVTDRYYINYRSNDRFGYRFNPLTLPVGAAQFIRDHQLTARVLNHFNEGGFLMWAIDAPVAIDGRNELIGEEAYVAYMTKWYDPDKAPILKTYLPDVVVVPHFFEPTWISFFAKDTSWRLAYYDHLSAVYLRGGYAPAIPPAQPFQWLPNRGGLDLAGVDLALQRPDPAGAFTDILRPERYPQEWIGLSSFAFNQGWLDAAVQYGVEALRATTVPAPELYYNLGNIFFAAEDWARASYCYGRFLLTNDDALARERYEILRLKGAGR